MSHLKISILSDFICFREGITALLRTQEGLMVVQELDCTTAAIEQVKIQVPHIVLYDYHSCPHKRLDSLMILEPISVFSKVIVLCTPLPEQELRGVNIYAYHSVEQSVEELNGLIWKVAAGYRPAKLSLEEPATEGETPEYPFLTNRELTIAKYVVRGMTSKEIGDILGIASKTVEVHRYNILKKLRLSNTSSLVNFMTAQAIKGNADDEI